MNVTGGLHLVRRIVTAALGLALTAAACGTSSADAPTWTFAPPTLATAPATNQPTATTPTAQPEVLSTATNNGSTTAAGTGATGGLAAAVASATAAVRIANFAFAPASVTVHAGGQVTWTNTDGDRHSILLDGSESPRLDQSGTFSKAFTAPGRFAYVCGLHSSMSGVVVVVAAGSPGATVSDPGTTGGTTTTPGGTASPDPTATPMASPGHRGGDDDDAADDDNDDDAADDDHSGPGGGDDSDG